MNVGSLVTMGRNIPSIYWLMSSAGQLIVDTMGHTGLSTLCILGKR